MALSTHSTRQTILEFVERVGKASVHDIATMLGPEWLEPRKQAGLRKTLRRMVPRFLRSPKRNEYLLSPGHRSRSFDNFDGRRKAIKAFLVERCREASTAEIHDAVGRRNLARGRRDYSHQLTTRVLSEAPEFCQIRQGDGRWYLNAEEREQIPLIGEWADIEFQIGSLNRFRYDFATWQDARASFFDKVGSAFMEARGDFTLSEVVAVPDVAEALQKLLGRAPSIKAKAMRALDSELGVPALKLSPDVERLRTAEYVLFAFEFGELMVHLAAPPELYRACARLYGVCPARLSRGDVVPIPAFGGETAKRTPVEFSGQ